MNTKKFSIDIGGKTLTAEFSDLTDQANGSVIVRMGNTAVLATVVMSENEKSGLDYFPLSVDFEEKFYAAGAILGSRFMRREGRPSDEAILSGRVIDRTIRPSFDHNIRNEIQVIVIVLSIDEDDPDILAINAASLALATSDIPWNGPVSAVRIGKHKGNDKLEINPSYLYRNNEDFSFDMIACGKNGNINMVEVSANEKQESLVVSALKQASEDIEKIQKFQNKIVKEIGKKKKEIVIKETSRDIIKLFEKNIENKLLGAVFSGPGKENINKLKKEWLSIVEDQLPEENTSSAVQYIEEKVNELLHREAIENDRRADGRKMDELRELYVQAGNFSPMIHGTGIFYRGGTHIFSALTLGGPEDSLLIDSVE